MRCCVRFFLLFLNFFSTIFIYTNTIVRSFISIRKYKRCDALQVGAEVGTEVKRSSILPNTNYEIMIPPRRFNGSCLCSRILRARSRSLTTSKLQTRANYMHSRHTKDSFANAKDKDR